MGFCGFLEINLISVIRSIKTYYGDVRERSVPVWVLASIFLHPFPHDNIYLPKCCVYGWPHCKNRRNISKFRKMWFQRKPLKKCFWSIRRIIPWIQQAHTKSVYVKPTISEKASIRAHGESFFERWWYVQSRISIKKLCSFSFFSVALYHHKIKWGYTYLIPAK